jgi:hypothetical protein
MYDSLVNLGDFGTVIILLNEVYGGSLDAMIEDIGEQAVIEATPKILSKATPKIVLATLAATGAVAGTAFAIKYAYDKKKEKKQAVA